MGNNIILPYSNYISGGIKDGDEITISGKTHHDFRRFSVNLCVGPTIDSDVAVHFNPRFEDGRVVRNHKQGSSWGNEETNGGMPFRRGHNFEINMKVDHQAFKVSVNGRHFCIFRHRVPKERIQYLYIEGDALITFIQFHGKGGYPTGNIAPPAYPGPPGYPSQANYPDTAINQPGLSYPSSVPSTPSMTGPIYNPTVPFMTPIQGGLFPGRIIYISGVPKHNNPSRFTINLACGAFDTADYSLHFDVRFKFGSDHQVVVRTHKQAGKYATEERHQSYFPFMAGVNFEMMILGEHNCFKVAVNNQHFTEFFHRIQPMQKATYLNILGDVQLLQVRFQ